MKSSAKDYPTSLGNPINSTAARVVSKGVQYVPNKKLTFEIWDTPPPTIPVPSFVKDLIGTRQNRMQIIGYLGKGNKDKQIMLARCDCGKHEKRIASTWRKMRAIDDCCQICRHVDFLKHKHLSDKERDERLERLRTKSRK